MRGERSARELREQGGKLRGRVRVKAATQTREQRSSRGQEAKLHRRGDKSAPRRQDAKATHRVVDKPAVLLPLKTDVQRLISFQCQKALLAVVNEI